MESVMNWKLWGARTLWHATTTPRRPTLMVHVHSRRNFTIAMAVARMTWTTTGSAMNWKFKGAPTLLLAILTTKPQMKTVLVNIAPV